MTTSTSTTLSGVSQEPRPTDLGTDIVLGGDLLAAQTAPIPKVSVPVATSTQLHETLAAIGHPTDNTAQTYHMTPDYMFLSSVDAASGTTAIVNPLMAIAMGVDVPSATGDGDGDGDGAGPRLFDNWHINLSLPMIPGAALNRLEDAPGVTFGFTVSGSAARITSFGSESASAAGFGVDTGCLLREGGTRILTTFVAALPALAGGPDAFKQRLLDALGPTGVDIITGVMSCLR